MKKIIHLIVALFITAPAFSLDPYDEIANAIRSGDAKQISTFFGASLDLSILNQEDVYSKAQAELILRDFFSRNTPKSFEMLHKGASREGTQYGIGKLTTSAGKFYRVSFFIKNTGGRPLLQELRFEAE